MFFYFKTHHVLWPGSKYVICTPWGFSVMIKVALWLTNEAKSDFPDVKGQDLKEGSKTWNSCVSAWEKIVLGERQDLEQMTPWEGCAGCVMSPGGPGKDWPQLWPPLCVGPHVCAGVMNHSYVVVLDGSIDSFHCVLRGFFWRLLCKTGNLSYQFFSEVLVENSVGQLFNMFAFLYIYSLYKMWGKTNILKLLFKKYFYFAVTV